VTRETRDSAPGTVISQYVPPGRVVEIGTTVDFVTATLVTVAVPPLLSLSREAALAAIQKADLKAVDGGTKESRKPAGTVISQAPAAGTVLNIGSSVSFETAVPMTVLVPELTSKLDADARRLLAAAELGVGAVKIVEDRKPQGTVLQQSIAPGTKVTIGTSVDLDIATPVRVLAPALLDQQETAARKALTDLELVVGSVTYKESPAATGTVQTQSIAAGTRTAIGTAVDLVVAAVETTPMPRVIGLTVEAARQALVASRLTAGTPELRESRTDPRGNVIAQPIEPEARVPVGTAIVLTVATPAIVSVPPLDGQTHDEAIATIRKADLTPGGVNFAISWRWRPGGTVIEQDRRPGERVEFGSTVSVIEARSRAWLAGSLSVLLGVAGLVWRKPPKPGRRPAPHDPNHVLVLDISAEPHLDLGTSAIRSTENKAVRSEVRVLPVIDPGTQSVAPSQGIVIGERRANDSGNKPPER
jgi:serine/threonine-protein kinase